VALGKEQRAHRAAQCGLVAMTVTSLVEFADRRRVKGLPATWAGRVGERQRPVPPASWKQQRMLSSSQTLWRQRRGRGLRGHAVRASPRCRRAFDFGDVVEYHGHADLLLTNNDGGGAVAIASRRERRIHGRAAGEQAIAAQQSMVVRIQFRPTARGLQRDALITRPLLAAADHLVGPRRGQCSGSAETLDFGGSCSAPRVAGSR